MTAVLPSRRPHRHSRAVSEAGIGFDATPGVLVAVCGLHGGAGTTATAAALAEAAAAWSPRGCALAVEAAAAGELARILGVGSPLSLARLAALVAAGAVPDGASFAERADGLRVLAATQPEREPETQGVAAVLREARRAHALVVCDVGSVSASPAAACLPIANAVLWVARAERLAATNGRLAGVLARPAGRASWGLVVCGDRPSRRALAAVRDDVRGRVVLPDDPVHRPEAGAALVALVQRLLA